MRLVPLANDLSREILETGLEAAMLAVEAHLVVAYRTLGLRPVSAAEVNRMVAEKPPAFAASAMAAGITAMSGQRPDQIWAAAIHPLRIETNRNIRRLGREDASGTD